MGAEEKDTSLFCPPENREGGGIDATLLLDRDVSDGSMWLSSQIDR
jgi:hypothetical protein